MPDYNPDQYQLSDRDKRIKALLDGGMPFEEAVVTVDATLNATGVEGDEQSHQPDAAGNVTHVQRVEAGAGPSDPEHDPSPNPRDFRRSGPG